MNQQESEIELTDKQQKIRQYLLERANGEAYFKSRLIGKDLDLSPKEVGANIATLAESDPELTIERWGYSSSTTWKVIA